jgi:alpha-glucuronidase
MIRHWLAALCIMAALLVAGSGNETAAGRAAWLRYAALDSGAAASAQEIPSSLLVLGDSEVMRTAQQELVRGYHGLLGKALAIADAPSSPAIVLGTYREMRKLVPGLGPPANYTEESYLIARTKAHGVPCLVIAGGGEAGVLYGVFALLSRMARGSALPAAGRWQGPAAPIRWVNQWDNLDGTIERGYAGPSIFFENGHVRRDLTRAGEYARLLASVGINGCTINNVNADPQVLTDEFLPELARIADVFRPWGVRLALSVNVASPKLVGGLDTFDPADARVAQWWKNKAERIYKLIPDFAGFTVKADSEGRPGPAAYGRTPADAADVIARALAPHGGVVMYRAFVYDHHLDWRDPKADRARAAYDIFHPLDGKFDDNVVVQIKNGPIDFQVREPASPLLGGLRQTNEAIELQITQEYTGQQRQLCYLPTMWKETLDFDMRLDGASTPVRDLVAGRVFHQRLGGFAGVANVGMDENWLAHPLAMANLYGFGRLAWDPSLSARDIAEEWTRLTFGNDAVVVKTISDMLMASWHTYENYTGPLGAGTLTNITGNHYDPGIESSERNGWGQWHRADAHGIGMDRTMAEGTGYVGQYSPSVAKMFESRETTPDELLLFFHHVPYSYRLHSGKTVIQHIYDSHYEGAEQAAGFVKQWEALRGRVDDARYDDVKARLEYQAGEALVWRDAVCGWFRKMSGVEDEKGRRLSGTGLR